MVQNVAQPDFSSLAGSRSTISAGRPPSGTIDDLVDRQQHRPRETAALVVGDRGRGQGKRRVNRERSSQPRVRTGAAIARRPPASAHNAPRRTRDASNVSTSQSPIGRSGTRGSRRQRVVASAPMFSRYSIAPRHHGVGSMLGRRGRWAAVTKTELGLIAEQTHEADAEVE